MSNQPVYTHMVSFYGLRGSRTFNYKIHGEYAYVLKVSVHSITTKLDKN
jgi:hypothetical protein